jgi:hypothetical protein
LLDSTGAVIDEIENAVAIRYIDLATGVTFDYTPSDKSRTMLALFGAKTLATNEASQARQSGEDEMAGINARFAILDSGAWVDKTRDGTGVKFDLDLLSTALGGVMVETGATTQEALDANPDSDGRGDGWRKIRAKLEDAAFVKFAKNADGVIAAYNRLKGKETKSIGDLAALVGL